MGISMADCLVVELVVKSDGLTETIQAALLVDLMAVVLVDLMDISWGFEEVVQ